MSWVKTAIEILRELPKLLPGKRRPRPGADPDSLRVKIDPPAGPTPPAR